MLNYLTVSYLDDLFEESFLINYEKLLNCLNPFLVFIYSSSFSSYYSFSGINLAFLMDKLDSSNIILSIAK
jgi:hypothetical protein